MHALLRSLGLSVLFAAASQAAGAADPARTLRIAFSTAESTFDPALFQDNYSSMVADNIFDPMLGYDYLARPAKLVPNTLESLPEVSGDGTTYTFRLRKGIYFTPDAAFGGKRRELAAADYAFSILRFFDPKVKSPNLYLVEDRIVGLDEALERARRNGKFDYDAPHPGLQVLDRYTLRIHLKRPDDDFLHTLAMPQLAALAREVVERHGDDVGSHPIGTGPYMLKQWTRGHRIVLEANPEFRDLTLSPGPSAVGLLPQRGPRGEGSAFLPPPWGRAGERVIAEDAKILDDIAGRKLPLIGRVEISIIEEAQPRWLAFLNGEHDLIQLLPNEFIHTVAPRGELAPYLAKRGVRMVREIEPRTAYTYFNFLDPVVGGYEPEKVALRRAIALAYNVGEEILILRKGQATAAQGPIPPGVNGYDAALRSPTVEFNPAKAKALLDMFGYVDRDGDGYRERPDGSPLTLEMGSRTDLEARQSDELWKKCMDEVGLRMTFRKGRWPDLLKESLAGRLQMWSLSWSASSPDGDFWMGLFYGPNSGKSNDAHFKLAEYDRMFEQARALPESPERTRLYQEMTRRVLAYAPWVLHVHYIATHLVQPWVKGYKKHPFRSTQWRYLDVDVEMRRKAGATAGN